MLFNLIVDSKVNEADILGLTPLLKACENALPMTIKVLLDKKADIHFVHASTGDTALHIIARCKKPQAYDCVKILLDYGAEHSIHNKAKKTPIDEAEQCGNKSIFDGLTELLKSQQVI